MAVKGTLATGAGFASAPATMLFFSAEFSLLQVIQILESDDNDDPRAHDTFLWLKAITLLGR